MEGGSVGSAAVGPVVEVELLGSIELPDPVELAGSEAETRAGDGNLAGAVRGEMGGDWVESAMRRYEGWVFVYVFAGV